MKILLDYAFPISVVTPTPAASTAFLKQVGLVCLPKAEVSPGSVTACTSMTAVGELTDNEEAQELFDAGMTKVFIVLADDLDLEEIMDANANEFYTLLISSDFDETDLGENFADLEVGGFDGVVGFANDDGTVCSNFAAIENRCAFYAKTATGAKNMCYAFGKLLSNTSNWLNQQYVTMPESDDVELLGDANTFFDDKVSFVIEDEEFGNRLGLFAAGGKAIVAPYILKNLRVDLQSTALTWISANQPQYTIKEAALLENRLQESVINSYIERKWIDDGLIEIGLEEANFVAAGEVDVAEPKALWRVFSEMRQTL